MFSDGIINSLYDVLVEVAADFSVSEIPVVCGSDQIISVVYQTSEIMSSASCG